MASSIARFKGGYRFRLFKGTPRGPAVRQARPHSVVIPLAQGFGSAPKVVVEVGAAVCAGQVLAEPDGGPGSPVHTSIDGTVTALSVREGEKAPWAVVVEAGGPCGGQTMRRPENGPARHADALFAAGVTSLAARGFLGGADPDPPPVETLIVACLQTAPLVARAADLFAGREEALYRGGCILRDAVGAAHLCFAVGQGDSALGEALSSCARDGGAGVYGLPEIYPQENATLLGRTLGDAGAADPSRGMLCVSGQAALAAYDAVVKGVPAIHVRVSLGGSGLQTPAIIDAYVGTPLGELAAPYVDPGAEVRYIAGNALTGVAVDPDAPLTRDMTCVAVLAENRQRRFMAFMRPGLRQDSYGNTFLAKFLPLRLHTDTNIHGEYRPCINCGWCERVCPSGIMPDLLMKLMRADQIEEADALCISDCVECGLCSYVCPSKLPLYEELAAGKVKVAKELRDG